MGFLNKNSIKGEQAALLLALDRSQAIIHFKTDGTILDANENFLNAVNYSLSEIKDKHHSLFVEKAYADSNEYKNFWNDLRAGKFQAAEYKRLGKGGKEIWLQATYNPIMDKNGKAYKVVKYATDITAQTLQNADFKGQIDAIGKSQAVIHFNMDGTIVWANENFLGALGYRLADIQGKHHRIFVEPAYAGSRDYAEFWNKLGRGEFDSAEYKRIGFGGKEVWIQASYNPIFDPTGKPFKVVKYATDITNQVIRRMENERVGNQVDDNLGKIVQAVRSASDQTTSAAGSATQASTTVQTIAAGAEELSSSIREISQSMARSRESVEQALQLSTQADESTQKLTRAADQMTGIVGIIQDIANQINLLALNATIESARAGEAGKGFAVVASEVKNLAGQVGQATDRISQEINGMQSISGDVVRDLSSIRDAIGIVHEGVATVASAIEEQSAVTREISTLMQTSSQACAEVDGSLREIMDAMQTSNTYVEEVQDMSKQLRVA